MNKNHTSAAGSVGKGRKQQHDGDFCLSLDPDCHPVPDGFEERSVRQIPLEARPRPARFRCDRLDSWILPVFIPFIGWLIIWLWWIAALVLTIIGIMNVLNGKEVELPFVGKYAKNFNF